MVKESINGLVPHYVCYIPEIRITVSKEWIVKYKTTGNPENGEKRAALLSAIKRWIYLSYLLESEKPTLIEDLYARGWIWDEIGWIKKTIIPNILSPLEIDFITPEYVLQTGNLVQFSMNKKPITLDFSKEVPPKPSQ